MQAEGLPSFPLSDYFNFEYSPNLTAPTPEPSSLWLLLMGLLLLGMAGVLQKRHQRLPNAFHS
jgi:hypothetical protein